MYNSVLLHNPDIDVLLFKNFEQIHSPSHDEVPYGFKIYAIQKAKDLGYEIIIWLDSVIRFVRDIKPLLPEIESRGVYLQEDGWNSGQWANDRCLNYFKLSRDDATNIPGIYACIMIFDFKNSITMNFFNEWKLASQNGIFKGRWDNTQKTESQDTRCLGHRHDQVCAEIISYKLQIPRGRMLVNPKHPEDETRYFTTWNYS